MELFGGLPYNTSLISFLTLIAYILLLLIGDCASGIPAARLLGRALQTLRFFAGGKGACMRLTLSDYAAAEALPEHNTGIVNYALDLPAVEMAFLAEEREEECKASLRAVSPRTVQVIAKKFGGGGHALASGMRYDGPIEEMEKALIREMTAALAREEQ